MKKNLLVRALFIVSMIGVAFLLVYFIFKDIAPDLIPAVKSGNEAVIEAYLAENDNFLGMFLTVLLQMVQVISIMIPSMPIQIAAGVVFGTIKGFIICHLANVAANALVYVIYSKMHAKMDALIDENNKTMQMIRSSASPTYMVAMACLIPAIPNGFIPYAAVAAKVPLKNFVLAVYVGSLCPIFVLCAIGNRILTGDFMLVVFLLAISFVAVFILTKNQNKIIGMINKVLRR